MEDDDDNDSVILENRIGENAIGTRATIVKSLRDGGSSGRRDRRRNRRYDQSLHFHSAKNAFFFQNN